MDFLYILHIIQPSSEKNYSSHYFFSYKKKLAVPDCKTNKKTAAWYVYLV